MPTPGARYFGGTYTRSGVPRRGIFAAVDVTNQRSRGGSSGARCATRARPSRRGGLVFVGRNDGRLTALDKANGALLWEFETDAGIHAAVSTFEHNGQQYVVALRGRLVLPGHEARRQPLAVLARRRLAAGDAERRAVGRSRRAQALAGQCGDRGLEG